MTKQSKRSKLTAGPKRTTNLRRSSIKAVACPSGGPFGVRPMDEANTGEINWTDVEPEVARQILHQGEMFMASQMQAGIASDQRAMTVASVFSAFAMAVAAGSIAYWDKVGDLPILIAGLVAATVMTIGSAISLWSARQVDFYYPGNHPSSYFECLNSSIQTILGGEAENYQERIGKNAKILQTNGRATTCGAAISMSAPMLAVGLWLLIR